MHFNGQTFSGVSEHLFFFVFKNANLIFSVEKDFECSFRKLKCRWLQTGLTKLKKHQTIETLPRVDISCIFRNDAFFKKKSNQDF